MIGGLEVTVDSLSYHNPVGIGPTETALVVDLKNGERMEIPHQGWDYGNPALKVMAYLDAPPSRMENAEGESMIVTVGPNGNYQPHEYTVMWGENRLRAADWFEPNGDTGPKEIPVE